MQIACLQQLPPQGRRIAIAQKRVLDYHSGPPTGFEFADEMLDEQIAHLARFDREVLLHLRSLP